MSTNASTTKVNILLCISGSVACVKVPALAIELTSFANVIIVTSSTASENFLKCSEEYYYSKAINEKNEEYINTWKTFKLMIEEKAILQLFESEDLEWACWSKIGDPVLHIEVRKWADMLILCPASANTIAKVANGISDSFMLSIIRAWDFTKPSFVCPAMNTLVGRAFYYMIYSVCINDVNI
jgi:phosphopantothenoylcysteine synthetase/decarboxylase